eukprot:4665667-Ditylum_brightwellii.AAC.1
MTVLTLPRAKERDHLVLATRAIVVMGAAQKEEEQGRGEDQLHQKVLCLTLSMGRGQHRRKSLTVSK